MDHYDVFVYGTLRKRGTNHYMISQSPCMHADYVINGYCLYDYRQEYPYMITGQQEDQVIGEVYRVDQPILRQLDELEDVENMLYKLVYLHFHHCYTYIKYDENVEGLIRIMHGDWIRYIESLKPL